MDRTNKSLVRNYLSESDSSIVINALSELTGQPAGDVADRYSRNIAGLPLLYKDLSSEEAWGLFKAKPTGDDYIPLSISIDDELLPYLDQPNRINFGSTLAHEIGHAYGAVDTSYDVLGERIPEWMESMYNIGKYAETDTTDSMAAAYKLLNTLEIESLVQKRASADMMLRKNLYSKYSVPE